MKQEVFAGSWIFSAAAERQYAWRLADTRRHEDIALFGYAKLNGRAEADALNEKCRFHAKLDNCEAVIESLNVYPFGGESTIGRTLTLRDKLLQICVDIKPGKGEVVRDFALEDLFFPGEFVSAKLIKNMPAENMTFQAEDLPLADGVLYESSQPWIALLLTTADGFQIELGTGGDWWRMLGAGASLWKIIKTDAGITISSQAVALAADAEIQRRPWRFNYYLAWGKKSSAQLLPSNEEIIAPDLKESAKSECYRAPAVRKLLRKLIRQQLENSGNVLMQLPDLTACCDAGHLERPGKKSLPHWSLEELFALYSWGNRALGADRNLRIELPADSIFRQYPSARYLSNHPGETLLREE